MDDFDFLYELYDEEEDLSPSNHNIVQENKEESSNLNKDETENLEKKDTSLSPRKEFLRDLENGDFQKNFIPEEKKRRSRPEWMVPDPAFGVTKQENRDYSHNNKSEDLHGSFVSDEGIKRIEEVHKENEEYLKKAKRLSGDKLLINDLSKEVVIANGFTVADLILSKRKRRKEQGNQKVNKVDELVLEKRKERLEGDPTYTRGKRRGITNLDNRRKGNIKKANKKAKEALVESNYFQKFDRLSSNQIQLFKSLGLTKDEVHELVAPESELDEKEKAILLSSGYFGNIGLYKGTGRKVRYHTIGDKEILEFMVLFRVVTLKTLELITSKPYSTLSRQMRKMESMGLVKREVIIGPVIWRITSTGLIYLYGEEGKSMPNKFKQGSYSNFFNVAYLGALLYSNKVNVLKLDDFPYYGRELDGVLVRGETIVPEWKYKSSFARYLNKASEESIFGRRDQTNENLKRLSNKLWLEWEQKGRYEGEPSPDEVPGQEFLYVINPSIPGASSVFPDMVIKRPRGENGEPNNIAVELELAIKKTTSYEKRFRAYKADKRLYKEVVYVVERKQVAKRVLQAAANVGFDRIRVVANLKPDGSRKTDKDPYNL